MFFAPWGGAWKVWCPVSLLRGFWFFRLAAPAGCISKAWLCMYNRLYSALTDSLCCMPVMLNERFFIYSRQDVFEIFILIRCCFFCFPVFLFYPIAPLWKMPETIDFTDFFGAAVQYFQPFSVVFWIKKDIS